MRVSHDSLQFYEERVSFLGVCTNPKYRRHSNHCMYSLRRLPTCMRNIATDKAQDEVTMERYSCNLTIIATTFRLPSVRSYAPPSLHRL